MVRAMLCWAIAMLAAVTAGCTMCAHPYDYCDPPFPGGCGPCLPSSVRAGSILSPGPMAAPEVDPEQVVSEQVVSDQAAPMSDDAAAAFSAPSLDEAPEEAPRPATSSRWIPRPAPPMR